jgi:hypothetical protein
MGIFTSYVHKYFDEIAECHGMRCSIERDDTLVRFDGDRVSLSVYYDRRRSYELSVGILLPAPDGERKGGFSLDEVLRFRGAPEGRSRETVFVDPGEDLESPLKKLAALTTTYAEPFLRGDPDMFAALAELSARESFEYTANLQARQAITGATYRAAYKEAEDAWEKKDYARVIRAFRSIPNLSSWARERLAIAERIEKDQSSQ